MRENTADIFWRIIDLSSCKMKVKRCAGQPFLLHPSPDVELPGTSLLLELLRAQMWKPNPATTPTLQLFLDMELHVTPNLHPCSMISLSELSHTLKKPWMTSYDSTTSKNMSYLLSFLTPHCMFPTCTSEHSYWVAKAAAAASGIVLLTLANARYPPDGKK